MRTKKIKIYNQDWIIKWFNDKQMRELYKKINKEKQSDGSMWHGLCDETINVIYLNTKCSEQRQRLSFIHELIHAIIVTIGIDQINKLTEEVMCDFVACHYDEITKILKKVYNDE